MSEFDPNDLSDENLDAHASEPEPVLEEEGIDDGFEPIVDEDQIVEEDVEVDDSGEPVAAEDLEQESDESDEEFELRFANQVKAEEAHREAERRMQQALNEVDHLKRELNELKDQRPVEDVKSVDPQEMDRMLQDDPISAFETALGAGDTVAARRAIAAVNSDAQNYGAIAAEAQKLGDEQTVSQMLANQQQAALIAEDMRARVFESSKEQDLKPFRERESKQDMIAAWNSVARDNPQAVELREEIGKVLSRRPSLLTNDDGKITVESARAGYEDAYRIAGGGSMNEDKINELLEKKLAEREKNARKSAARGAHGEDGASTPPPAERPAQKDPMATMNDYRKSQAMSVNEFFDL